MRGGLGRSLSGVHVMGQGSGKLSLGQLIPGRARADFEEGITFWACLGAAAALPGVEQKLGGTRGDPANGQSKEGHSEVGTVPLLPWPGWAKHIPCCLSNPHSPVGRYEKRGPPALSPPQEGLPGGEQ